MSAMTWADVLACPYLENLPFKVELNKWGKMELSLVSNERGMVHVGVGKELSQRRGGRVGFNICVTTTDGVRVADVAWLSDERLGAMGLVTPYLTAPEICLEIKSPSNSWAETEMKAALCLEAGANEVWVVEFDGRRRSTNA
jgi:Uma2 family endonuclease